MSRSSAWDRVMLARSTTRFDRVVDAIYGGEIGTRGEICRLHAGAPKARPGGRPLGRTPWGSLRKRSDAQVSRGLAPSGGLGGREAPQQNKSASFV